MTKIFGVYVILPTNIILIEASLQLYVQVQLHEPSPVKHNQPLEHHH